VITVHVAKRDEVFLFAPLLVRLPCDPSPGTDECDIQLAVGGPAGFADSEGWECDTASESGGSVSDECSTFHEYLLTMVTERREVTLG
jgi:hypothetical protein